MNNDKEIDETAGGPADKDDVAAGARRVPVRGEDGAGESAAEAGSEELSRVELENELELARAEIERLQDQSLRRQAELINFRRRAQKELAESSAAGQSRLLELLLPVIDDFERAVDHEAEDARAYHQGMQIILRSLQRTLEQIGLQRIEPLGETFDPEMHEAIARHETDEVPQGQILEVYQPGYRLGERLIRPATVVVAYGGGQASQSGADDASEVGNG
ncbi:MAG: nucleotide exchange factor GrpE [Acidobacteriota bacterium]|jgi:molecular chaperone GrpE